jgi:hypothetical protein
VTPRGKQVLIAYSPLNYSAADAQLESHLEGIDTFLAGLASTSHASTHVLGGGDELDGDEVGIDFTPNFYTPATGTPGSNADHLAAHLRGIDNSIGSATGDVNGPASSTDNVICRFSGTGGKTIQGGGTDGVSDNPPTYDDDGNLFVDPSGSTLAIPRIIGGTAMADGEGIRFQFGDANNGIQNGFDQAMQLWSYHSMIFSGDRNTTGAPSMEITSNISHIFRAGVAGNVNVAVDGTSGQTGALQQWRNSSATVLASVLAGGSLQSARCIGHDAEYNEGNSGTSIAFSFDTYQNVRVTMTGNCTATLDDPPVVGKYQIKVLTGAGGFTLSFSTTIYWADDDTYVATTTASRADYINLYWDGSAWWGQFRKNFPTA